MWQLMQLTAIRRTTHTRARARLILVFQRVLYIYEHILLCKLQKKDWKQVLTTYTFRCYCNTNTSTLPVANSYILQYYANQAIRHNEGQLLKIWQKRKGRYITLSPFLLKHFTKSYHLYNPSHFILQFDKVNNQAKSTFQC